MIRFTVSTQIRWPDGLHIVEITSGNSEYVNPDCLEIIGEYETASEAVEAAISTARDWAGEENEQIFLACGSTLGMTAHFDVMPRGAATYAHLRKWAREYDANLPRCAECGEILGETRYGHPDIGEYDCCSEYCAEKRYYVPLDDEEEEWY